MIDIAYRDLVGLCAGKNVADVACPLCGPDRRQPLNRKRQVMRLWPQSGFISYHCARCGESGFVREDETRPIDRDAWQRQRTEMAIRDADAASVQARKVAYLWRSRRPIIGSIAQTYLREARGITCSLPTTLGFLPVRGDYPPAMIAAFGLITEPEPGVLAIADSAVIGLHLTRLQPDGGGKVDDDKAKIMIGRSLGSPIALAPMNDALGLTVSEGIEDALSIHQATGLGAWAAGAASRMPALAEAVPDWTDCVSVLVDGNEAGRKGASGLAKGLRSRGIHVELIRLGD